MAGPDIEGLPAARDMAGRVLIEGLRVDALPPVGPSVPSYERDESIRRVEVEETDVEEQDQELLDQLRVLGYVN
jgi:hypothetical protein